MLVALVPGTRTTAAPETVESRSPSLGRIIARLARLEAGTGSRNVTPKWTVEPGIVRVNS